MIIADSFTLQIDPNLLSLHHIIIMLQSLRSVITITLLHGLGVICAWLIDVL